MLYSILLVYWGARFITRKGFENLIVKREVSTGHLFRGEEFVVSIHAHNRSWAPLVLGLNHGRGARGLYALTPRKAVYALSPGQQVTFSCSHDASEASFPSARFMSKRAIPGVWRCCEGESICSRKSLSTLKCIICPISVCLRVYLSAKCKLDSAFSKIRPVPPEFANTSPGIPQTYALEGECSQRAIAREGVRTHHCFGRPPSFWI